MRAAIRQPEEGNLTGRLEPQTFRGAAGALEGLWKEAQGPHRGSAVFAHPHPLHGGTLHNKVVYRAARALTRSGYGTLRFNFRGVGLSEGRHDAGRGEVEDFRAALDQAETLGGRPIVAGGFSFGASMALRAADEDARIIAMIALGLPLATESGRDVPRPRVPTFFAVGERDTFVSPADLARFAGGMDRVLVLPDTDHFFAGSLPALGDAIEAFLAGLGGAARSAAGGSAP